MDRRRFLAAGAAGVAGLAGCLDDVDAGNGDGPTRTLQLVLSSEPTTLRSGYVVDLAETDRPADEDAFRATLDGERVTSQHRRPFGARPEDPVYTRHEGTYYRLGAVVVDEAAVTRSVLRLSAVGDVDDADVPAATAADDLPERDRTAVHVGHMAARARGNEGGVPWGLVQRGGYVYRDAAAVEASRLLADDGPSHVSYRGTVYAVEVSRERFHEPVYRATADPVAETPERMEAILRAQFVTARLSRDALPDDARAIIRDARDGYEETHPYSEAYRTVLRGLHARAYLDGNVEKDAYVEDPGTGVVLYDGMYYDYRIRFVRRG
ncbi:hypothetical protein [Haloplanus pelagicus]|jgi:hypothetical protein|uniref:hypothetical protein n=1 Tax=Haloplanus pelagicus TaxID=2949995 RepID=UPI002040243F|nr:hypothetical protein [Haloplanus sp. HW8-1]